MDHRYLINCLERNMSTFSSLLRKSNRKEYLYKPTPESWCLLEIVCHLYDEEAEDFRMRLQTVLESPHKIPPAIDPESWPRKRDYINQDFRLKAKIFKTERKKSIAYLRSLDNPKWDNYYEHPTLGKLDGNHFLRNWVAHDYLHIRQITKRKYEYLQHMTSEDVSYAGVW